MSFLGSFVVVHKCHFWGFFHCCFAHRDFKDLEKSKNSIKSLHRESCNDGLNLKCLRFSEKLTFIFAFAKQEEDEPTDVQETGSSPRVQDRQGQSEKDLRDEDCFGCGSWIMKRELMGTKTILVGRPLGNTVSLSLSVVHTEVFRNTHGAGPASRCGQSPGCFRTPLSAPPSGGAHQQRGPRTPSASAAAPRDSAAPTCTATVESP